MECARTPFWMHIVQQALLCGVDVHHVGLLCTKRPDACARTVPHFASICLYKRSDKKVNTVVKLNRLSIVQILLLLKVSPKLALN